MPKINIYFLFFINVSLTYANNDFYDLLGVPRDANNQEIRKAFKKLAIKLHPDKNPDDPGAHENFLKIAKAYEILKQPETRKHYDLHGDTGSDYNSFNGNQQFRSYSFYRDHFGIYDDDPTIVTLSKSDYEINVLDDSQAWFVNFYSPQCYHCHDLAPMWRKIALEFEGIIRLAAVNCEDDWALCYQLNIRSYPSLVYYEQQSNIYDGEHYSGHRAFEALEEFIMKKIFVDIPRVSLKDLEDKKRVLLFSCTDKTYECLERKTQIKLAVAFDGVLDYGLVEDVNFIDSDSSIIIWENGKSNPISGSNFKEIMENILNILPNPDIIDENEFNRIRSDLQSGSPVPWLLCFYLGPQTNLNLQLKRLPVLLSNINIGLVHCGRSAELCTKLHVPRYPAWGVLKVGGAFELHHGMDVLNEVTAFVKDSVKSTNLHTLSPDEFDRIKLSSDEKWFVDWYAPWCPPCKKLMPEIRKASQRFDKHEVRFGTVDCTIFRNLCSREGITSYPTMAFYSNSSINHFHGMMNEDAIVEFVEDMIRPSVVELDGDTFKQHIGEKPKDQLWFVDFYAPWCGPCQKLSTEWRKLAKRLRDYPHVKIGQVDCVRHHEICTQHNVRAYPTLRLYPFDSAGLNTVVMYSGNRDALSLERWILNFVPSNVTSVNAHSFQHIMDVFEKPILVDFYAPWCGHCTLFDASFRKVADRLNSEISFVKLDCQSENRLCRQLYIDAYPTVVLYLSKNRRVEIEERNVAGIVAKVKELIEISYAHDEL